MENKGQSNRIKLDSYFYLKICEEHHKRLKEYERKVSSILAGKTESLATKLEAFKLQEEMAKCGATVVVFAAFFLEAWIYAYTVKRISKLFYKKCVDRLTPASKWVIVTRRVTGRNFPTDSQAYQHLKSLYEARNGLVHPTLKDDLLLIQDSAQTLCLWIAKQQKYHGDVSKLSHILTDDDLIFQGNRWGALSYRKHRG